MLLEHVASARAEKERSDMLAAQSKARIERAAARKERRAARKEQAEKDAKADYQTAQAVAKAQASQ